MARGVKGTMNQSCLCDSPWHTQGCVLRLLPCSELCPIFIASFLASKAKGLNHLPKIQMNNRSSVRGLMCNLYHLGSLGCFFVTHQPEHLGPQVRVGVLSDMFLRSWF